MATGKYIVLEGGEAVGKTTQVRLLSERLGGVATVEPGGTVVGTKLRSILLDPATENLSDRAELLLMNAARAQLIDEVVRPALTAGQHVVSDRSYVSTLAYQGYGRGLSSEAILSACHFAIDGCQPDLVIVLDVPLEVSAARLRDLDRFEQAGDDFHARVRRGFLEIASAAGYPLLDASVSVESVHENIWAHVEPLIKEA